MKRNWTIYEGCTYGFSGRKVIPGHAFDGVAGDVLIGTFNKGGFSYRYIWRASISDTDVPTKAQLLNGLQSAHTFVVNMAIAKGAGKWKQQR